MRLSPIDRALGVLASLRWLLSGAGAWVALGVLLVPMVAEEARGLRELARRGLEVMRAR